MKVSHFAVLFHVCLVHACSTGDGPECDRSQEDEVLLLQTDLKLSTQSVSVPLGESQSETDHSNSQQNHDVLSLLGRARAYSSTGIVANSCRSNPDMWLIVLVICAIVILVPVTTVFMTEIMSPHQNAAAELLENGKGKRWTGTTTAPSSQRQLRVTYSERIEEHGEPGRKLPPTAHQFAADSNPPPICPSLVLPTNEARFMISLEDLQAAMQGVLGPMDIKGLSGQKLLHGVLEDVPGIGRRLSIASVRCESDPRAIIVPCNSFSHTLYGRDHEEYGTLEFVGVRVMLKRAGTPVIVFDAGDPNELHYTASRMDGRVLASAGRQPNPLEGEEDKEIWRLQVRPGIDAILVMVCMLSVMLLPRRLADGAVTPSLPGLTPRASVASMPRTSAIGRGSYN
eukprot:TRINITY_DN80246_c0_g1_i1.p1 TRINITY_DN80246_c0_g1~~TRINITY_DN80246_c0_g1_i1.p1  ORF type:complete len:398 (-),score=55.25 TRINITY_DN80246_c0_g1_i1:67-1260(-)